MADAPKLLPGQRFNPYRKECGFYPPDVVGKQRKLLGTDDKTGQTQQRDVTDGQKRLYERLVRRAGQQGKCWPSQIGLAEELGKSDRQIRFDLDALESLRLIDRDRKKGIHRHTVYFFLWHAIFDSLERTPASVQIDAEGEDSQDLNGHPLPFKQDLNGDTLPLKKSKSKIRTEVHSNLNGSTAYFERKPTSDESSKELSKGIQSSSSSGSAATEVDEDEDGSLSKKNGTETDTPPREVVSLAVVGHPEDDIREFGERMRDSLVPDGCPTEQAAARYSREERPEPRPQVVLEVLSCAPTWTASEIWEALKTNSEEKPSKPKTYSWFKTTVADVYKRWNGVPPKIAPPKEPKSPYKLMDAAYSPMPASPEPELSYAAKVERWRRDQQHERWKEIFKQHRERGLAAELDSSKAGSCFHWDGNLDERDAILDQLEAGVPFDQVVAPETADTPKTEQRVAS